MTDPDFNLCRQAEFPRFHHLSDSRLCLFLSKGGWQTPWNNPRTLTSARPTVTSQETNGWSKEGQRKLERQRDRKQVEVEQRRWGGRTVIELDSISCSFSWKVRRCRSGWEAPHASAENHISSAEGGGRIRHSGLTKNSRVCCRLRMLSIQQAGRRTHTHTY